MQIECNDAICASCSSAGKTAVNNDKRFQMALGIFLDTDRNGILTEEEFNTGFGQGENCRIPINTYCKFTSADQGGFLIAWS